MMPWFVLFCVLQRLRLNSLIHKPSPEPCMASKKVAKRQAYPIDISNKTIIPSATLLDASLEEFALELKEALDANMLEERPIHLLMSDHSIVPNLPQCDGTWAEFGVFSESCFLHPCPPSVHTSVRLAACPLTCQTVHH
jgi:hypothetical protein